MKKLVLLFSAGTLLVIIGVSLVLFPLVGNILLDGNRFEMRSGEKRVSLTNKEYQLMELFVQHPGFVFSTDHLMEKVWGLDTESDIDVVWTTIGYVRKKLRSIDADVEIKTIRGAGYSLEVIKKKKK